jgi:hypothetical protein
MAAPFDMSCLRQCQLKGLTLRHYLRLRRVSVNQPRRGGSSRPVERGAEALFS